MTEREFRNQFSTEAFQAGEPEVWASVFCQYYSELYEFAANFTSDRRLAQHIVQESFIKLWMSSERFCTLDNIKSFIYITTRNNCIHATKLQKEGLAADLFNKGDSALRLITDPEKVQKIKAAVAAMPEAYKKACDVNITGP